MGRVLDEEEPLDRMVFVGDSAIDHRTAQAFGMEFWFVSGFSEWAGPPPDDPVTTLRIPDLVGLAAHARWQAQREAR